MNKDKFQILRDFAKSNEKPDKTIYEYVKEVLDMNSAYAKENQELKKQLDYLRSGEYLNQLRFERDMLQHVVDTNGVPSEVYDYLECTHRNTELLEENQELKKQLEEGVLEGLYFDMITDENIIFKNQQKEFIEYLKSEIKNSDICDVYVHGMKFNSAEKMIYKDILSKYKEIIGGLDEQ